MPQRRPLQVAHVYQCFICNSETWLIHELGEVRKVVSVDCPKCPRVMYHCDTVIKNSRGLVRFLLWVGFIRIRDQGKDVGKIRWPFSLCPWWIWKSHFRRGPRFQVFRNRPDVVKWSRGRLLPRRWGIAILGFEFGDRG